MPDYLAAGGVTKLSELTIDTQGYFKTDIATVATAVNATDTADAALYFRVFPDEFIAAITDNANLTAAKAASIFDNANLTVAKLADIFGHTNLSDAKVTSIFNSMTRAVADLALIFDDADVGAAKAAYVTENTTVAVDTLASIFDNSNLTAAKAASICDNTNLTLAKAASIFENTNLTITKINSIITNDNISDSRAQEILNETDYATRDLTGADSILYAIHDDWADNKLTSRDDRATTPADVLGANEFAQKFRPEWTTHNGSPSATGGKLSIPAGSGTENGVKIATSFNIGTWECTWQFSASTSGSYHTLLYLRAGGANKYNAGPYDGNYTLYDYVDSVDIISSTWDHDTNEHTLKLTRDNESNWELFYDGVSKGTATDSTTTNFDELGIFNRADQDVLHDWLKVY